MPRRTYGSNRPRPRANGGELLRDIAEQLRRDAIERHSRDRPAVSHRDRHHTQKKAA